MSFLERVGAHPLSAMSGCLVWIPVTVWVLAAISWMISGDIEAYLGLLVIGAGVGLGAVVANPPDPALGPVLLMAVIVSTVMFPFARVAVNQRALVQIDFEQMDKYAEEIRMRPNNVGAMVKLAELLYKRGYPGHAIGLADRALPGMPVALFRAEHNMVNSWKAMVHDPNAFRPVPCLQCQKLSSVGILDCEHCGYPTVLAMAKGQWMTGGFGQQLIAVWIALTIALVGIPASSKMAAQSPLLSVGLIVLQATIAVVVVLKAFLKGGVAEKT